MRKVVLSTLVVLASAGIISWMREGDGSFSLPELFPLFGGFDIGFYDFAGALALAIAVWGWSRLSRPHDE